MVVSNVFRVIFKYQKNFLEKKMNLILIYIFLEFGVLLTYYLADNPSNIIKFALNCIPLQIGFEILLFIQKTFYILFLIYLSMACNDYMLKINKAYLFFRIDRQSLVKKIYISNITYILLLDLIVFLLTLIITNFHLNNVDISLIATLFFIKLSIVNFSLLIKNNFIFCCLLLLAILLYMFYIPSLIFSLLFTLIFYVIYERSYIKTFFQ